MRFAKENKGRCHLRHKIFWVSGARLIILLPGGPWRRNGTESFSAGTINETALTCSKFKFLLKSQLKFKCRNIIAIY